MAALMLMIVALGATAADACPPGPCNKYRRMPLAEAQVQTYRRAVATTPPARLDRDFRAGSAADRRALERFLTGSVWVPISIRATAVGASGPARTIRFVSPARITRGHTADRLVIVRRLERRARTTYVEIDGRFFALSRCRDGRTMSACLDRVDALPEDDGPRFATPPP